MKEKTSLPEEVQFCFIFSTIAGKEVSTVRIKSYSTHRFVSQFNPSIKQYFLEFPFRGRVSNIYEVVPLVYFIPNELQIILNGIYPLKSSMEKIKT